MEKSFEPATDSDHTENVFVGFRIMVPSAALTRGGAPDHDGKTDWSEVGLQSDNVFECKIDPDRLYVAIYDADDGSPVGKVDYMLAVSKVEDSSSIYYDVVGKLSFADTRLTLEQLKAKNVKVMVLANVLLSTEIFGHDLSSVSGGVGETWYSAYGKGFDLTAIPMWGVVTKKFEISGTRFDIGEIAMLRSMAKIEVKASEDLTGMAIEAVTVSKINEKGFILPGAWNTCGKTENIKFSETLRVPDQTPVSNKTFKADSNAISIYLPECKNESLDDITLTVRYRIDGGEEKEGIIKLCRYDENGIPATDATPWDVVRNHHYRYTITGVGPTEDNLRFKVTIKKMENGGEYVFELK